MSAIPEEVVQMIDEADAIAESAGLVTRIPMGERPLEGRFPIYCAPDIHVDELVAALSAHGFVLTAKPAGWYLDHARVIELVRKDDNTPPVAG